MKFLFRPLINLIRRAMGITALVDSIAGLSNQLAQNRKFVEWMDASQKSELSELERGMGARLNNIEVLLPRLLDNLAGIESDLHTRLPQIMAQSNKLESRIEDLSPRLQEAMDGLEAKVVTRLNPLLVETQTLGARLEAELPEIVAQSNKLESRIDALLPRLQEAMDGMGSKVDANLTTLLEKTTQVAETMSHQEKAAEGMRTNLGQLEKRLEGLVEQNDSARKTWRRTLELATKLEALLEGEVRRRSNRLENGIGHIRERSDNGLRDALLMLNQLSGTLPKPEYTVDTKFPVAIDSVDHQHPRGTWNDNTRCPQFSRRYGEIFGRPLKAMDLGGAGGGLVLDFLLQGHRAIGLEGSNLSFRSMRAEWRLLQDYLFTCDVGRPFSIREGSGKKKAKFDIISAWELLEHLPEDVLPQFFINVRSHLKKDGIFAASVATFEDKEGDIAWHVTIKPREWWLEKIEEAGFALADDLFEISEFPRGSGNGPDDWDVRTHPEMGFHLVAKLA